VKWLQRALGLPVAPDSEDWNRNGGDVRGVGDDHPFHQLDKAVWSERTSRINPRPSSVVRYLKPNDDALRSGETVIVDLSGLRHVETQRGALRKRIGDSASRIGRPAFRIDSEGCLLVVPGRGVRVDQKRHVLGTAIWQDSNSEKESLPI
jgi:hypothetical protein